MTSNTDITFITNNVDGGIASFLKYLAKNKPDNTKLNIIATTNKTKSAKVRINPKEFSKDIYFSTFFYHPLDKRIHILNKLKKLIKKDSIIVANDWLELEMATYFKLQNPLIFILHGDYSYYYNLAKNNKDVIDSFITINKGMSNKLEKLIQERKTDIYHQYPPVTEVPKKKTFNLSTNLKIIYAGWINSAKGVFYFPEIDKALKINNIYIKWNIFGIGDLDKLKKKWTDSTNVNFNNKISNRELLKEYKNNDIVILPSHAESLGLTIVEGMKAQLTPIITKLETGAREFINNGDNGFLIEKGNINEIVDIITSLNNDRQKLIEISTEASKTVTKIFDEKINAAAYFKLITSIDKNRVKIVNSFQFSNRLDNSIFPNFVIKQLRLLRKYAKK